MKTKLFKRSIILSIISMLVLSLAYTGVYASSNTASITLENEPETSGISIMNKTFDAYKLFDLVQVKEYSKYQVSENFKAFFSGEKEGGDGTLYTFDEPTSTHYHTQAQEYVFSFEKDMDDLVADLEAYIVENEVEMDYTSNESQSISGEVIKEQAIFSDVVHGYYLILDDAALHDHKNAVVAGILNSVNEDITIKLKGSVPTLTKQIYDMDDGEWKDAASFEIEGTAYFKVTSSIPNSVNGYETYMYCIKDELGKGLTYNKDLKIFVDEENTILLEQKFYTLEEDETSFTLHIDIINLKKEYPELATIYTMYTAKINKDLMVEDNANLNNVSLTYSRNPYDEEDTGVLDKNAYAYGFDLTIFKTMEDEKTPLKGAKFALYKMVDGKEMKTNLIHIGVINGLDTYYCGPVSEELSEDQGIVVTNESGYFKIVGLKDKTDYIIKEIEAPHGFTPIKPIPFTISAEYAQEGAIVESLEVSHSGIHSDADGLAATIANAKTSLLPDAGGMGTTILYVVGIILCLSSTGLLIKYNRKQPKE